MYFHRVNGPKIRKSFSNSFITAILGPRRVGKSTFVQHFAEENPDFVWVFFTMDALNQRNRIEKEELEMMILEQTKMEIDSGKKFWVVVDEAQKCPEIFEQIKILYDRCKGKECLKFILTGSGALDLHRMTAESLAGRVEIHYFYAFTLREAGAMKISSLPYISLFDALESDDPVSLEEIIRKFVPFRPELERQLEQELLWGGLPEVVSCASEEEKIQYLSNYIQTYLERDIRSIQTITDFNLYRHLLDLAAEQTGSVRDDTRILKTLGCTRETLKKYRGFLTATLFYKEIFPFIGSIMQRVVKSPKGYLLNNGMISVLTGINQLSVLEKSGLIGARLENWFLSELSTWLERDPKKGKIFFWRLQTGSEVDFIVEKKPQVFPFEVTSGKEIDKKKVRTMIRFLQKEPGAPWGYYIYRGEFHIDRENKICFLPAWAIG